MSKEQQPSKLYSEILDVMYSFGHIDSQKKKNESIADGLEELFISRTEGAIDWIADNYWPNTVTKMWSKDWNGEDEFTTPQLIQEYLNTLP